MKHIIVCLVVSTFSTFAFAAKPTIPIQFIGHWETSLGKCKQDTDSFVNIEANGFNAYEHGCKLKAVVKSDEKTFTAKYLCYVEGEKTTETHKFIILPDGKLSFRELFVRCK